MNASRTRFTLLAATLVALSPAAALSATARPSEFALPTSALDLEVTPVLVAESPDVAAIHAVWRTDPHHAGVHYGARGSYHARSAPSLSSGAQIHLGFFDPDGEPARAFLVGIRGGPRIDEHVQLGLGLDWAHNSDHATEIATRSTGPGGVPITIQRDIARASTDLVPLMGFLQLSAGNGMGVIPYVGGGAGYQVMNLSADDYQSGQSFNATYGGWSWQLWGGAALPLSGRTRLTAEVFANGGELGRDVADPLYGDHYRETVSADGVGARFGLAWGF